MFHHYIDQVLPLFFYQTSKNYFYFHSKTIVCKLGYFLKMCTIFVGLSKSEWFVLSNEVFYAQPESLLDWTLVDEHF